MNNVLSTKSILKMKKWLFMVIYGYLWRFMVFFGFYFNVTHYAIINITKKNICINNLMSKCQFI